MKAPDEELTAVVRFTPRLVVELWKSAPLLAQWLSRLDEGEAAESDRKRLLAWWPAL
jgi:hypothetical protein